MPPNQDYQVTGPRRWETCLELCSTTNCALIVDSWTNAFCYVYITPRSLTTGSLPIWEPGCFLEQPATSSTPLPSTLITRVSTYIALTESSSKVDILTESSSTIVFTIESSSATAILAESSFDVATQTFSPIATTVSTP